MNEGWFGDEHFILFTPEESADVSAKYGIEKLLPGFTVAGLRGWDDFLVKNAEGHTFTVPTVPVDPKHIRPIAVPKPTAKLKPDERLAGKIKWYLKPLAFGGDVADSNTNWVTHEQHQQLVAYWNKQYRALKGMSA